MKPKKALISIFFVLAFAFAHFSSTRAEFIYDTSDNVLENGGTYYIRPAGFFKAIEGVSTKTSTSTSSSCSLAVVQQDLWILRNGRAVKITTPFPLNYITNDYPLNISFATLPSNDCTDSPSWIVTKIDEFEGGSPVMVGNFEEFRVPISGYFYIKQDKSSDEGYYKFAFCKDKDTCGYVILKSDSHGNDRLVVSSDRTEQALLFKFDKVAASDEVVSDGISMVI